MSEKNWKPQIISIDEGDDPHHISATKVQQRLLCVRKNVAELASDMLPSSASQLQSSLEPALHEHLDDDSWNVIGLKNVTDEDEFLRALVSLNLRTSSCYVRMPVASIGGGMLPAEQLYLVWVYEDESPKLILSDTPATVS